MRPSRRPAALLGLLLAGAAPGLLLAVPPGLAASPAAAATPLPAPSAAPATAAPATPAPGPIVPVPGAPPSFADLVARLLPAVVNVSSTSEVAASGNLPEMPNFPPGSPFEQFFKDFMKRHRQDGGGGDGNGDHPAERQMQSLGSGFIIDPSGLIVTNNHVIEGADSITVTLQDNTVLKAKVIGRDTTGDLALLKVDAPHPLPFVAFGDSAHARVGDWVLAIGNPFGLGGTVTAGIVSARGRDIQQGPYDDFIQTDAAINRGNSGGPLFDMQGHVIGINTAIFSPSGGSIGIGFSIPSNMAKADIAQLRQYGHPRRGWLGVRIQEVTPDIAESLGLPKAEGALVAGVNKDGPADRAHLRNGDVILTFNGEAVKDMHVLPRIVAEATVGEHVPLTVWRDGKAVTLQAVLAEKPDDTQQTAAAAPPPPPPAPKSTDLTGIGLAVAPITAETQAKFHLSKTQKGVVVTGVTDGSPAADRGVQPGDVVLEVQQQEVHNPADVAARIAEVRKDKRKVALFLIQRGEQMQWVPLALEKTKPAEKKK
ncbi:MAG: DegQ family serine endoprotease [Rhodospirillales bacterium]|nr:DegQ family serine endoprotease [Rhodospirillales bacterium]